MSGVVLLTASGLSALTAVLIWRVSARAGTRDDRPDVVSERWIAEHQTQDRS
jgi:hypothetical protein